MEPVTPTRPATHRIGDEERHKTAELLSDHHAHGRLSQEEFEDRLGLALTAQTSSELGRLLADLPLRRDVEPEPDRPPRPGALTRLARSRFGRVSAAVTVGFGGLGVLSALTADDASGSGSTFVLAMMTGLAGLGYGSVLGWWLRHIRRSGPAGENSDERRAPWS